MKKSNAESAGEIMTMTKTLSSLPVSARVPLVSSISNALNLGFCPKSKKNHQAPQTLTLDHSTGRGSNAKSANKCTHTLSKLDRKFTKL